MTDDLAAKLLVSIEGNRLVVLCGAGLSMAAPSNLPSAKRLADSCWQKYQRITAHSLPDCTRHNLEALAKHFWQSSEFVAVFIQQLIEWQHFRHNPNTGHRALADFLACGIIEFAISTNLDTLIEVAAEGLGEKDFIASIDPHEPDRTDIQHKPLIKLHGCCVRTRDETVWCDDQLNKDPVLKKISGFKKWIEGRLPERDLLIIGFWSDWAYLNNILWDCVSQMEPRSVILVDPSTDSELQAKASELWKWANKRSGYFEHVRQSGDSFLDELRRRFSERFLVRLIDAAKPAYKQKCGNSYSKTISIDASLTTSDLYALRRDFTGEPTTNIVRIRHYSQEHQLIGLYHLLLIEAGANLTGPYYQYNSKTIRLVHAAGQLLSSIKERFSKEPSPPVQPDLIACVGAADDPTPPHLVRGGTTSGIVRAGYTGKWITHHELFRELGVNVP